MTTRAVCLTIFLIAATSFAQSPAASISATALGDSAADLVFTPLPPCRIIDTRLTGLPLAAGFPRSFKVKGTDGFTDQGGTAGGCGVPSTATVAMINFVAVNPQGAGNLRGSAHPNSVPSTGSILNYQLLSPNLNIANGLAFPICDGAACAYDITVLANGASTQLVADVFGYFKSFPAESVGTAQLAPNAVTASKISPATSTVGDVLTSTGTGVVWQAPQGDITAVNAGSGLSGGATSGDANLSVTFGGTGSAASVARSDHSHYVQTVIVSPAATAQLSGTALINALAGITDASASKWYLLKIEPGLYDLGTTSLAMKPYVDIEGSGQLATTIRRSSNHCNPAPPLATILGASNAELRMLTAENIGDPIPDVCTLAMLNSSASPRVSNVTFRVSGGTKKSTGVQNNDSSPAVFRNVDIIVTGFNPVGVWNIDSAVDVSGCFVSAVGGSAPGTCMTGGNTCTTFLDCSSPGDQCIFAEFNNTGILQVSGGPTRVQNSRIRGSVNTIRTETGSVRVTTSQLDGGFVSFGTGTIICVASFDENYSGSYNSCP